MFGFSGHRFSGGARITLCVITIIVCGTVANGSAAWISELMLTAEGSIAWGLIRLTVISIPMVSSLYVGVLVLVAAACSDEGFVAYLRAYSSYR